MAGIGFALERLYRSNSIADRMASFAHASIIAAGPCLLSVLCIWLISATINELEGKTTIAAFRALIIYSFALSFVITAPIALVSARFISDKLHDRDVAAVSGIMLAASRSDRKSTRLNSSHANISYAVFCLKKKKKIRHRFFNVTYLDDYVGVSPS